MQTIHGSIASGFEPVAEAFRANFGDQNEVGASCCVYLDGKPVVDLWGGVRDRATQRAWEPDTLAVVFSATKGVTAACVHLLVERGQLDLDAPIARYWPEFAAAGKQSIPLRWALCHRVGLPVVESELSRSEVLGWKPVVAAIAAQSPLWEPGSKHGYHVRTYGWILGEVVRRRTGMSVGQFLAREVSAPLSLDFHISLPEQHEARVATLYAPPPPTDPVEIELRERFMGPGTFLHRALNGPADLTYGDVWNTRAVHAAEIPSSNGIGNARSLARLYAATIGEVDGFRLLRPETIQRACKVQSDGPDATLILPTRFGLGFMRPPALGVDCPDTCFGHPGAGGSLAFADPQRGLSFAYVMNQMQIGLTGDERTRRLIRALYGTEHVKRKTQ